MILKICSAERRSIFKTFLEGNKLKRFFLSSDIEGTCGIANWQETNTNNEYSPYFLKQMSNEVKSACLGALESGYGEVIVKDAHDSARNIYPDMLPKEVKIIRDWTKNPLSMMAGIDIGKFDAAGFTGYHSGASSNGNPLSHTMNLSVTKITINGRLTSEFVMNAYAAAYYGVPTVFLAGDKALCETALDLVPEISVAPVSEGYGGGSISIHPEKACEFIKEKMMEALSKDVSKCLIKLPESFEVVVQHREHSKAYRGSFYPGVKSVNDTTNVFCSNDYMEVMKFFMFTL